MSFVENVKLFDSNFDGKFDKEDFNIIGIELNSLETDILKEQIVAIAPKYKNEVEKVKDKESLKKYLFLLGFANNVLDERAKKALLRGEVVNGYKWDVPFDDTISFLKDLLYLEKQFLEEEFKLIVFTLNELRELEELLVSHTAKKELREFLKLQIKENISSHQVVEDTKLGKRFKEILGEEKASKFLNDLDNNFRKLAQQFLPDDISDDTLYNIGTGINIGLMNIYCDLNSKERKVFLKVLDGIDKLSNGKDLIDRLDGFISTLENGKVVYKVFKIFAGIRDFLKIVKNKTQRYGLKSEKDWEKFVNLNNPTRFAEIFEQYEIGIIKGLSDKKLNKIVDELFSDVENNEKIRIEKINQISSTVMKRFDELSDKIDKSDLEVLVKLSMIDRKVVVYKKKIEKKIGNYINELKDIFEKMGRLLCVGQKNNKLRNEIEGIFYSIVSMIVKFLKSFGLEVNIRGLKIEHLSGDLKKFNETIKSVFLEKILTRGSDRKYRLVESLRNNRLFKNFSNGRKYFEVISFDGILSQQTLDWFKQQNIDLADSNSIFEFIVKKLNNSEFINILKSKGIDLKKYNIFQNNDSILTINFDNLDYLLREGYGYGKGKIDNSNTYGEQIIQELKVENNRLVFKEDYPEYKKRFLKKIYPTVKQVANRLGIPVIVPLTQAALESRWGTSKLAQKANNLFGIKAGKSWNGPIYKIVTTEYKNGKRYKVVAKFRKYSSWEESIKDYEQLLTLPKYQKILVSVDKSNPEQVFEALMKIGYSSDPNYGEKLRVLASNIIHNLEVSV